jgi:hypothetical protein
MSKRMAVWLAWSSWTCTLALILPALFLEFLNNPATFWSGVFETLVQLAFATVGALVAARRPQHPIGWLFCVGTLLWACGAGALEYAVYAVITVPGALPGGVWMTWFGGLAQAMGWPLVSTFLLLFFPNGRLPSPRWRPAAWLVMCDLAQLTVVALFGASSQDYRLSSVHNPLGIEFPAAISEPLTAFSYLFDGVTVAICVAALIVRFQRATGTERQQIKWFAYAAVLDLVVYGFIIAAGFLVPAPLRVSIGIQFGRALFVLAVATFPIATGIAILKHRLYDIDLIIRRTLIYSVLTTILALIYFGSVVLLQSVFRGFTGQAPNQFVTVLSTLTIAVLFTPLRRWVQDGIDRRFYRRKYNTEQVLAAFAATCRNETDLDKLTAALVIVVAETIQPTQVALWLCKPVQTAPPSAALSQEVQ